ncbi:putative bifunctional diguanylate cyclase/phosphodiesterase [Psychromonas sp. GE-S-Ul-11]|uniref:putative bifunctional diguanylate cyclase/phosphodiesterase n=1 Tax=Psychromonas sp. GE-S-Ul-11 TaxID=3241170 RepID=UPI00390C9F11
MNTAMHIMSIQHQLVLAIGEETDLKKMLYTFLHLAGQCLNTTNNHIFIMQDKQGTPVYQLNNDASIQHFLSFPSRKEGINTNQSSQLMNLVTDFFEKNIDSEVTQFNSSFYYLFKLGEFGVFIIERRNALSKEIQSALPQVINKLTNSCIASINYHTMVFEIKMRKEVEAQIRYQATHDDLTGLYNRMEVQRCLTKAIQATTVEKKTGYVLSINLMNFKSINDAIGYHVGDKVLRQVADRIKNSTDKETTIAIFNGHEFILIIDHLPANKMKAQLIIGDIIAEIIHTIEHPFELAEGNFSLSCFIGYERFTDNSKTAQDIIKNASIAMYEAFKKSKDKALAYKLIMSEQLNQHIRYTKEIKQALINNDFELHYQPQFDHLYNMIGAEALLRWNHPTRGYESPAVYIPIAEESDLIIEIGNYVLEQACRDIKRLRQRVLPTYFEQISINVSAKQLAKRDFVNNVIAMVNKYQIPASSLKIEITESIMMGNLERSIDGLNTLLKFGVTCAIDDFGTGYSSLAYLKRLPASLLKIDRSFVTDIHLDQSNKAIISMIIQLAKSVNMEVIAEGVETEKEVNCLIELGCYKFQGYYFSRPITFNKLLEYRH